MLSILIPVYNYDIFPLVETLHKQATVLKITFEIIIIDDCSPKIAFDTSKIEALPYTRLNILDKNIGRSAIRNLLANKAKYNNLLYVDAGTFPKSNFFIKKYVELIGKKVIIGGMIQDSIKPTKAYKLRWLYTKTSETKPNTLASTNFLIQKKIILNYAFDHTITTYGYEDVLFFNVLKSKAIPITFINNPVVHDPKEDALTFIKKNEDALKNLIEIEKKYKSLIKDNKIIKLYNTLYVLRLNILVLILFKFTKPFLIKNLRSSRPLIFIFNFYKLGYFVTLKFKI